MKIETGQTSEPTSANISIVSRSWKRGQVTNKSRMLMFYANYAVHNAKCSNSFVHLLFFIFILFLIN